MKLNDILILLILVVLLSQGCPKPPDGGSQAVKTGLNSQTVTHDGVEYVCFTYNPPLDGAGVSCVVKAGAPHE